MQDFLFVCDNVICETETMHAMPHYLSYVLRIIFETWQLSGFGWIHIVVPAVFCMHAKLTFRGDIDELWWNLEIPIS